jgi:hypothetical protein
VPSFIVNVLASIVAALILIAAAGFVSTRVRGLFTALTTNWLGLDVEYVFQNEDDARKNLHDELRRARDVLILVSRGNELQRPTFSPIFLAPSDRRRPSVRILLPATTLPAGSYDWLAQREQEAATFDPAYGNGLLKQLVNANVQFIQPHTQTDSMELRRFNSPLIGRLVVTERYAYYTPYRADAHGRESRVYKFRRGGEMYDNLRRWFEQLWRAGETTA